MICAKDGNTTKISLLPALQIPRTQKDLGCLFAANLRKIFFTEIYQLAQKNFFKDYRKVAYDVTHFAPKKWLTKRCNLCWKGIGPTPTFGIILKTNEKLIKN